MKVVSLRLINSGSFLKILSKGSWQRYTKNVYEKYAVVNLLFV